MAALACVRASSAPASDNVSVLLNPPAVLIHGASAADAIGSPVTSGFVVGDISGDGIADLVIPARDGDGPGELINACGEVHVAYGPISFAATRDLATEPADIVISGRTPSSEFGSAVLLADVDGDGDLDLVVGYPRARRPTATDPQRGEVCIFFGPLSPGLIDLSMTEPDLVIAGATRNERLGQSVSFGDVSGDGVGDLVIGAAGWNSPTTQFVGRVVVVNGPFAPGPVRFLATSPPDVSVQGIHRDGDLGGVTAVGDVSGDGIADIVAGGRGAVGPGGALGAGEAIVVFGGRPSGTVIDLATTAPDAHVLGVDTGDDLGEDVAVGDMNGDGIAEVFVAARFSDGPGSSSGWSGEVDVLLGPVAPGTIVDNVTTFPDVTYFHSSDGFARDLEYLVDGGGVPWLFIGSDGNDCPAGSTVLLHDVPARGSLVDFSVVRPPLSFSCSGECSEVTLGDLDGDGIPELLTRFPHDGPAGDRPLAGAIAVLSVPDRCEEPPVELGPDGITLRRVGEDVIIDFDDGGLGVDSLAVDVFVGTMRALVVRQEYDHVWLDGGCGLTASPAVDVGAAATGAQDRYYLATRACVDACSPRRLVASLGSSTLGEPRWPGVMLPDACP